MTKSQSSGASNFMSIKTNRRHRLQLYSLSISQTMLPFSTLLLRSYYEAIGWNEDNLYSNITRSSAGVCLIGIVTDNSSTVRSRDPFPADPSDFAVPNSLILQLANAPTPIFFTSYGLDALPQLNGSLSYITTSESLSASPSSNDRPNARSAHREQCPSGT